MIESFIFTKGELLALIEHHMDILNRYIEREKRIESDYFKQKLPLVPVESGKKIVGCLEALDRINNDSV